MPMMMKIKQSCLKTNLRALSSEQPRREMQMNMNRLISMGLRVLMRKGVDVMAKRGKQPQDMTPDERAQAKSAQQTAQKAQKGMRAARRFMR